MGINTSELSILIGVNDLNLRRFTLVFLLFAVFLTGCDGFNNSNSNSMNTSNQVSSDGADKKLNSSSKSDGEESYIYSSTMDGSKSTEKSLPTSGHSCEEHIDYSSTEDNSKATGETSSTNEDGTAEYIDYTDRLRFFQNYSPEILCSQELDADEKAKNKAHDVLYNLLKNNIVMFDIFVWGCGVELLKPNGEPFWGGDERPIICKCDYFDSFSDFYDTLCRTYTEECVDHLINKDIFKDGMPTFYEQDGSWCANDLPYSWTVNPFYECHYEITDISEDMICFEFLYSFEEIDGTVYSESRNFEAVMINSQWLLNKMVYNPI